MNTHCRDSGGCGCTPGQDSRQRSGDGAALAQADDMVFGVGVLVIIEEGLVQDVMTTWVKGTGTYAVLDWDIMEGGDEEIELPMWARALLDVEALSEMDRYNGTVRRPQVPQ